MRNLLLILPLLAGASCQLPAEPEGAFVHVVAFDLSDDEDPAALVGACRELLPPIEGVTLLRCGVRDPLSDRPYVDASHEVILVVEFADRAAYAAYQSHPLHTKLVELWTPRLARITVFDARY